MAISNKPSAVVYNNFSGTRYEWEPSGESLYDPLNRSGFTLKCSVGRGEAVSYKEAIDGDYIPIEAATK